jgi:predicted O-linked N-acetylglucosamine transferase (SPINDLY family)
MVLPAVCQTTLNGNIESLVNDKGDTLIVMPLEEAKMLLTDLLECEVTDSLLNIYVERDSLNKEKIILKDNIIQKLKIQNQNSENIIKNIEEIVGNKDEEISLKDKTIKEQKKEIKKQRNLKRLGFIGSILLPIVTLIILL